MQTWGGPKFYDTGTRQLESCVFKHRPSMIHNVLSDIECSNLCKAHLRKIPVEAMPKFSRRDRVGVDLYIECLMRKSMETPIFSRSDSIVLRRTTLQSTLLNTSQLIPPTYTPYLDTQCASSTANATNYPTGHSHVVWRAKPLPAGKGLARQTNSHGGQ